MSLLDSDNEDPYAEEDQPVLRADTGEPLFGDTPHKGKSKKTERRAKGEERPKPMHWTKQKENVVQEKTPKKPKGQSSNKPTIWTPPGSPKGVRAVESKGKGVAAVEGKGKGVVTAEGKGSRGAPVGGGQLQPSPNIKSQRKRYSQLGAESSSEEEGEGFLLSNKPALRTEDATDSDHAPNPVERPSSNPFLMDQTPFLTGGTSTLAQPPSSTFFPSQGPAATFTPQQQQPWDPSPSFNLPASSSSAILRPLPSQATPLVSGTSNPLLGMDTGPVQDYFQTNPFLASAADSAFSQPAFSIPPPPTMAPSNNATPLSTFSMRPDPTTPPPVAATPTDGVADWSISEDLCQKCVQQFEELEAVNGRLKGDKAKEFFIRSKLPSQELSAIW